jgi:hypothetical protein
MLHLMILKHLATIAKIARWPAAYLAHFLHLHWLLQKIEVIVQTLMQQTWEKNLGSMHNLHLPIKTEGNSPVLVTLLRIMWFHVTKMIEK